MTEEELFDLVNAKAYKKEAMQQNRSKKSKEPVPLENSLEQLLKNQGIL